jgi:hypothetical protein
VTTRNPAVDPQLGDEVRVGTILRRVVKREGGDLLIQSEHTRYWVRIDRWQRWCQQGGAEIVTMTVDQDSDGGHC